MSGFGRTPPPTRTGRAPVPLYGLVVESNPSRLHAFPVAPEGMRRAEARSALRTAGTVERVARKRRKRWSELSPVARTAIVAGSAAELVVTAVALRDLVRRP